MSRNARLRPPIPVRILTGALGAGKTTLINALLRAGHLDGSAIIVNEFGDIGLDHDLIESASDDVSLLAGGCLCCRVKEDLVEALMRLEKAVREGSQRPFDRVIIETSGLAEPQPLLQLFAQSPYLQGRFHCDALTAIVDARLGERSLCAESGTAVRQASLADRILISKWEHATPEQVRRLRRLLNELNPYAQRLAVSLEQPHREWLDPVPHENRAPAPGVRLRAVDPAFHDANHDEDICCFDMSWTEPQPLAAIGDWLHYLASQYGERLMRVKGIVSCAETAHAYSVHVVQHVVSAPEAMQSPAPTSRMVFITRGLEPNDVRPDWFHEARRVQLARGTPRLFPA